MSEEQKTENQDDQTLLENTEGEGADGDKSNDTQTPDDGAKPEWLSDELWDADAKGLKKDAALKRLQDADKHEKMAKDLREKLSRRGLPPEKPEEYKINIDDKEWKDKVVMPDELVNKVKTVAHKLGISQAQFGPLAEAYLEALATMQPESMTEEDQAAAAEAEKERKASEIAKLGENGQAMIRAVSGMIQGMRTQGLINDEGVEAAKQLARTAGGVMFLNAMRVQVGGDHLPMGDVDPELMGGVTHSEIQDLMNSDAYARGDRAVVDKVMAMIDKTVKAGNPFKYKV